MVVVDDDDISRRGVTELLADRPEITVLASLTHDEAVARADWSGVSVAIVDAADERQHVDQFPGVQVVEELRHHRNRDQTTVIVITGHFFDDAVRWRMREAGADFFYHRSQLAQADCLAQAVLNPDQARRGVPGPIDPEHVFRQGVDDWTRVNAGIRFPLAQPYPVVDGRIAGPRSRAWLRWRREFNQRARLHPVNTDGTPPERDQDLPSLPQISRFIEWGTKVKNTPRLP